MGGTIRGYFSKVDAETSKHKVLEPTFRSRSFHKMTSMPNGLFPLMSLICFLPKVDGDISKHLALDTDFLST